MAPNSSLSTAMNRDWQLKLTSSRWVLAYIVENLLEDTFTDVILTCLSDSGMVSCNVKESWIEKLSRKTFGKRPSSLEALVVLVSRPHWNEHQIDSDTGRHFYLFFIMNLHRMQLTVQPWEYEQDLFVNQNVKYLFWLPDTFSFVVILENQHPLLLGGYS